MEEAEHLCSRLALMDKGRIRTLDTTAGIIERTGSPTVMSFLPSRLFDTAALAALDGVSALRSATAASRRTSQTMPLSPFSNG